MNSALFGLRLRCVAQSPVIFMPSFQSPSMFSSSSSIISYSFSSFAILSDRFSSSFADIEFSHLLSRAVVIKSSASFTNQTSRAIVSSTSSFTNICFYYITSNAMGGAMCVSSSGVTVTLSSCEFICCVSSYAGYSAGGISVYQCYNFSMSCILFDSCSTTVSDTNSFQINSLSSAVPYCSETKITSINGGLLGEGAECLTGGSSLCIYNTHNASYCHCSSAANFDYMKPMPSGSVVGTFCQSLNSNGGYTLCSNGLTSPFTFQYANFYNNSGNSYFFSNLGTNVYPTFSHCTILYSSGVTLTSFTASSSYYLTFADCSFSWNPTTDQRMGNSFTGSNYYEAVSQDLNKIKISNVMSCFLYSGSTQFTYSSGVQYGTSLASASILLLIDSP